MLKCTVKILMFAPTCFGPPGPSSGSLCQALLKLQFTQSHTACVTELRSAWYSIHTTACNTFHHNTAEHITIYFY